MAGMELERAAEKPRTISQDGKEVSTAVSASAVSASVELDNMYEATRAKSGGSVRREQVAQAVPQRSWLQSLNPLLRKTIPTVPAQRSVSDEYNANILSALYFTWMEPLMSVGYQRPLEVQDIPEVNPHRQVTKLSNKFIANLATRNTSTSKIDPLALALYDTFKFDFLLGGLCQLIAGCIQVLSPFVLKYLILYVQEAYDARYRAGIPPRVSNGVGLAIGLCLMQILQSLCMNHFYYRSMLLGGQVRSVLIACIFEKATKLSGRAKAENSSKNGEGWSNGRINNIMSTDTSRIDSSAVSFHRIWVAPIQLILALALLCINLTYSALVGFAVICILLPLLGQAVKMLFVQRKAINKLTDKRIRLTQETFSAIRTVKLFAWEPRLLERLSSIRYAEVDKIAFLINIRSAILTVAGVLPSLASMLTFVTYSLSRHDLSAGPIFSSLALFNALGLPVEVLPLAIGRLVDAIASVRRISEFLDAEEVEEESQWHSDQADAVKLEDASFTWETTAASSSDATKSLAPTNSIEQSEFRIRNLTLSIQRGELIAVIGTIGSGKSSLISALAGEMRRVSGSMSFGASKALCSQTPWIQNATLRDNILFGKKHDPVSYAQVVEACALRPDIDMLPNGDLTEIGEKGVTISGGQKQRVNIARAIYFDTDIVLLDDPLSAVDAHVGQHILDKAICGLLEHKCRVLVTHQLHILHRVDRIIWLKDGMLYMTASYHELLENQEFQAMVANAGNAAEAKGKVKNNVEEDVSDEEAPTKPEAFTALMQKEEQATGRVKLSVYTAFIKASGSIYNIFLILLALGVAQGSVITTSLWLSWWTSNRFPNLQTGQYIGVYIALAISQAILLFIYATTLTTLCTKAGKSMVSSAMTHTMKAPMQFFDTTPIGRITNRFSKDVDTMDNRLTDNVRFLLFIYASIGATFGLAIAYFYYFVVALVPLTIIFFAAASFFRASAREIKRHEAVLRSVVFARFGEALAGITTIRAYNVRERFVSSLADSLDSMNGAYYLTFAGQRWLSVRLDTLGSLLILTIAILAVTSRFEVDPAISGLVLTYMLSIVQFIQVVVHVYADVSNDMNSVERLHYYSHGLEQEGTQHFEPQALRENWPERGELQLKDVQLRYRPGLPLVLKGLSVSIRPGERVGIVGRTGAGKTSIITALFRLVELEEGSIIVDGMNIGALSLHDLRSRLSIIPQDPTLFQGTIRSNLDPFEEHQDSDLWSALRQSGLVADRVVDSTDEKKQNLSLDSPVDDEGSNFSLGERQLLALARILVKNSKIVVFDEATSSVDYVTDQKVQQTILTAFQGKTLLCIAHRLRTIIGYDRIIVMHAGRAVEYDTPLALFDQHGVFHGMCEKSGISRADIVRGSEHGEHEV